MRHFFRLLWIGLVLSLATIPARSAEDLCPGYSVTLEWDANSEPDVAGYKLYFGTASGIYTETFDAGKVTVAAVPLVPGVTYFFAITAYNGEGLESGFSNEVVFTAPQLPELLVENIEPPAGEVKENGMPGISSSTLRPDGSFSFTVEAQAGQLLQVETSSDLLSWTCRGILENPTGGIVVTDTDASSYRQRFYRVVVPAVN